MLCLAFINMWGFTPSWVNIADYKNGLLMIRSSTYRLYRRVRPCSLLPWWFWALWWWFWCSRCGRCNINIQWIKLNSYSNASIFFYRFVACAFPFFEVKSVLPIDRYQNATSKAVSLHELKKVKLQERYTLLTQDSIGHLKTLCMSVLSLVVASRSRASYQ